MQSQFETEQGVGSELLSDAKRAGSSAADRLHSEVDARKGEAATQVRSISSAIEQAAGGLDANAPAWLTSAFRQGAQQIGNFAETLEQKDSRQIVDEVSGFARRSPVVFLSACAAAGFAAARIFKAGSSANSPGQLGPIGSDYPAAENGQTGAAGQSGSAPRVAGGEFA